MSRELRRVPLDFNWPIDKVWEGFINPHRLESCPDPLCQGGATSAREWLGAIVQVLMCAGDDGRYSDEERAARKARGQRTPHPYLTDLATAPTARIPRDVQKEINAIENEEERRRRYLREAMTRSAQYLPITREMTQLTEGLAGRSSGTFGHDAIDRWSITKKIIEAAGCDPETWGICPTCKGTGLEVNEELQKLHDEWEPTAPPEGPGYQVWETVSEGSPFTPVFATEKEMIDHLCDKGYSWKAAANFVRGSGWAPSAVMVNGEWLKNIEMHRDGPEQKKTALERVSVEDEV